jgi:KAP family P-loop domain
MGKQQNAWRDDPVRSVEQDTLGTSHVAERAARLIAETHSWESSLVFALTGPWGSGKTSLIEMTCQLLQKERPEWSIARFTPWATSDTSSLMAEFYTALATALPNRRSKGVRRALGACAQVVGPALKTVPYAGESLAHIAKQTGEALAQRPPWHEAFAKAAEELQNLGTPVLVVADDIDRLQSDELVVLLKVVRLLGRFPGVSYLLAYDEQTLFANLQQADLGADAHGRARLFMEKIVQYPITVPPLLPSQMLFRLDEGLNQVLGELGRPMSSEDSRLSQLVDVFESQFTTPRAIDRFLAQVRLFLTMHDTNEIDDVDLMLLTFVRMQFPGLYADLPRWRRPLTSTPSVWQMATRHDEQPAWDKLLEVVPGEDDRRDARRVLEVLFPAMARVSIGSCNPRSASNRDYFARYFVHTVPEEDIPDVDVTAALDEARTEGLGHALMESLLTSSYPGRADLALGKLWNSSVPERDNHDTPAVTLSLLIAVLSLLDRLEGGTNSLFRRQERGVIWAAELSRHLPADTDLNDLMAALNECGDLFLRLHVIWEAAKSPGDNQALIDEAAALLAAEAVTHVMEHLRLRDEADSETSALFPLMFIVRHGDVAAARAAIHRELGVRFGTEDLAARCVSIAYLVAANPIPRLSEFDQETFAEFAPSQDPLYQVTEVSTVDEHDVSWTNRRSYARARVRAPKPGSTSDEAGPEA